MKYLKFELISEKLNAAINNSNLLTSVDFTSHAHTDVSDNFFP